MNGYRKFSNLYRLSVKNNEVYEYLLESTDLAEKEDIKKLMNSARYLITKQTQKPAFYQGDQDKHIYSFEFLSEPPKSEKYRLSGGEKVSVTLNQEGWRSLVQSLENLFQKLEKVQELKVRELIEDKVELKNVKNVKNMKNMELLKNVKNMKLVPILRVEFIQNEPFLMVDYKLELVSDKDIEKEYEDKKLKEGDEVEFRVNGELKKGRLKVITDTKDKLIDFVKNKMDLTKTESIKKIWQDILNELKKLRLNRDYIVALVVLEVTHKDKSYTYPGYKLYRVKRLEDLNKDEKNALQKLSEPEIRVELIRELRKLLKEEYKDFIDVEDNEYTDVKMVKSEFEVIDGNYNIYTLSTSSRKILKDNNWKPFVRNPNIHVGFLAFGEEDVRVENFKIKIISELDELKNKGLKLSYDEVPEFVKNSKDKEFTQIVNEKFKTNVTSESNVKFIFVFMNENDDYWYVKRELLSKRIESQVILYETLETLERKEREYEYFITNLVLAFLGKTGNYPYFIKEDPQKKKLFVGVDISRKREQVGKTLNAIGTAVIVDPMVDPNKKEAIMLLDINTPTAGEKLDNNYFHNLRLELEKRLGNKNLKDRFIVLHRDGPMLKDEEEAFKKEFEDYRYALVSIVKSGSPRIFKKEKKNIQNPDKGDCIFLSDKEAIVCTYLLNSRRTHVPLRVKILESNESYTLEEALEDVLKLTLLNFSAFTLGKLPATISFADDLAEFSLHGVKYHEEDHLSYL